MITEFSILIQKMILFEFFEDFWMTPEQNIHLAKFLFKKEISPNVSFVQESSRSETMQR